MLSRETKATKPQFHQCCGKPFDPETQGRFKLAGTDTWLCSKCFDVAIAKRDLPESKPIPKLEVVK
jgi:hypothetical protein